MGIGLGGGRTWNYVRTLVLALSRTWELLRGLELGGSVGRWSRATCLCLGDSLWGGEGSRVRRAEQLSFLSLGSALRRGQISFHSHFG